MNSAGRRAAFHPRRRKGALIFRDMLQQAVRLDAIKRFSLHNLKIDKSYNANQASTPYFGLNITVKSSNESLETVINVTTCDMRLSTPSIDQTIKKLPHVLVSKYINRKLLQLSKLLLFVDE